MLGHPNAILVENDYYQLSPQYLKWCDALAFDTLYSQAATAPPEKALELHLEIISFYQGEFLTGFGLSEWGNFHRNRYEVRFMQVVTLAAERLLSQKYPREAMEILHKGLKRDYFQEGLHRLAFQAYAQLGLYDQLTEYYTEIERIFEIELGGPPTTLTRNLYFELLKRQASGI